MWYKEGLVWFFLKDFVCFLSVKNCWMVTEIYRLFTFAFLINSMKNIGWKTFKISNTQTVGFDFMGWEKFFSEVFTQVFRKLNRLEDDKFCRTILRRQHVRLRHTHFSYIISLLRRHGIFQAQDFFLWPFARVCRPDKREKRNH